MTTQPTQAHDAASRSDSDARMVAAVDSALARVRDVPGLTVDQRKFLAARLRYGSDAETARACGTHFATPGRWKAESALFREQYEALITASLDAQIERTRDELRRLVSLVPETLAEMMVADETIPNKGGDPITRPAWLARAKAVELLFRPLGMWQPEFRNSDNDVARDAMGLMRALLERDRQQPPSGPIIEGTVEPSG